MKRFDILVMGELNVDLILSQVQSFPKVGAEVIAKKMTMTLGSSSAIFASNAASLGAKVAFLGKLGADDFGRFTMNALRCAQVNCDFVQCSTELVTGVTVAMNFGEDRAMVTHPGAMEELGLNDLRDEHLQSAGHLHLSSIFLQPLVRKDLLGILKKAKDHGLTTSMDTQWDPAEKWDLDLAQILPFVDVFLPNEAEALALTRQTTVESAIAVLAPMGKTVVIKRGRDGAIAWHDGKIQSSEPFINNVVVDTIGAGDSFDAGFVAKFIRGHDIDQCLRFGNLAGALNTTAAGGTGAFANPEKIQNLAKMLFSTDISIL